MNASSLQRRLSIAWEYTLVRARLWTVFLVGCASTPTAQDEVKIAADLARQKACVDQTVADAGPDARRSELQALIDACRSAVRLERSK